MKFAFILLLSLSAFAQKNWEQKVKRIHEKILTLDTHADVPIMMQKAGFDIGQRHDFDRDNSQIDLPRMREGGLDGMFFAVYQAQGKRTPEANAAAKQKALEIFQLIHDVPKKYPEQAELARTVADVKRIHRSGKRIVLIGMENGWMLGNDLKNLQQYYDLGLRYITLSHSYNNDICDSSTDPDGAEHNGLSQFGETVVQEMNRLGMMIDVSHVADSSFFDVVRLTKSPLLASHSSCRALCSHKRNMSDEQIRALAKNGGVIQINFVPDFVKKPSEQHEISLKTLRTKLRRAEISPAEEAKLNQEMRQLKQKYAGDMPTVADVVNHIDHVVKLVGINHVGIGMDMDGGGEVQGCRDVSQIRSITSELLKRGYTRKDIAKIWGKNVLRVMAANEVIAKTYHNAK